MPKGVTWIRNAAATVDPDNNTVTCADGATYEYDLLVVCPGIQLDWNRHRGMQDALGQDGVSSNYPYDLAPAHLGLHPRHAFGHCGIHDAVRADQVRGSAAEDRLPRQRLLATQGVLKDIDVHLVVPTPRLFGIQAIADSLDGVAADYGITVHTNAEVTSVDAAAHKVAVTGVGDGGPTPCCPTTCCMPCRGSPHRTGSSRVRCRPGRSGLRRDRQAHHAARALPQRVQPR